MALADAPSLPVLVMICPVGGYVPLEIRLTESVIALRVCIGRRIGLCAPSGGWSSHGRVCSWRFLGNDVDH